MAAQRRLIFAWRYRAELRFGLVVSGYGCPILTQTISFFAFAAKNVACLHLSP